jgi:hypothetical protein
LTPDYASDYLPGQLLTGAGVGLSLPAFTSVAVNAVHATRFATAIGLSSAFRQIGGALGVAAFVALVGTPQRADAVAAYRTGWTFMIVAALAGAALMFATRFGSATPRDHRDLTDHGPNRASRASSGAGTASSGTAAARPAA